MSVYWGELATPLLHNPTILRDSHNLNLSIDLAGLISSAPRARPPHSPLPSTRIRCLYPPSSDVCFDFFVFHGVNGGFERCRWRLAQQ